MTSTVSSRKYAPFEQVPFPLFNSQIPNSCIGNFPLANALYQMFSDNVFSELLDPLKIT